MIESEFDKKGHEIATYTGPNSKIKADLTEFVGNTEPVSKSFSDIVESKPRLIIDDKKVTVIDVYNVEFPGGKEITLNRGEGADSVGAQIAILSHEIGKDPLAIVTNSWTDKKEEIDTGDVWKRYRYSLKDPMYMETVVRSVRKLVPGSYANRSLTEMGEKLIKERERVKKRSNF